MKTRGVVLILFVMALLVAPLFAVNNLDGLFKGVTELDPLMETKINVEEIQSVTTQQDFGGVIVLTINPYKQRSLFLNNNSSNEICKSAYMINTGMENLTTFWNSVTSPADYTVSYIGHKMLTIFRNPVEVMDIYKTEFG